MNGHSAGLHSNAHTESSNSSSEDEGGQPSTSRINLPNSNVDRCLRFGHRDSDLNGDIEDSGYSGDLQESCNQCGGTSPTCLHVPPVNLSGDKPTLGIDYAHRASHIRSAEEHGGIPDYWRKRYGQEGRTCRIAIPEMQRKFMSYKVECIIKDVLEAKLRLVKYDPHACGRLTQQLCTLIKDKTKEFEFDRYKLVTQVLVGQDSDQSVQIATRCLWNQDTDNFAAATFRNESIFAVAIVYGLHLD